MLALLSLSAYACVATTTYACICGNRFESKADQRQGYHELSVFSKECVASDLKQIMNASSEIQFSPFRFSCLFQHCTTESSHMDRYHFIAEDNLHPVNLFHTEVQLHGTMATRPNCSPYKISCNG
jgi:hypothetical protein